MLLSSKLCGAWVMRSVREARPALPSPPLRQGFRANDDLQTFRMRLLVAMVLVVLAITAADFYVMNRKVEAETEHDLERDFQAALASLHEVQEIRRAALAERCRALASKPRIHAALEDNA